MIDSLRAYKVLGIRGLSDDESYKIGDTCRNSFDWDYENDVTSYGTDNEVELNGTCATHIAVDMYWDDDEEIEEAINKVITNFNYGGKLVLIAGNDFEYGADEGEVIIKDAIVISFI